MNKSNLKFRNNIQYVFLLHLKSENVMDKAAAISLTTTAMIRATKYI